MSGKICSDCKSPDVKELVEEISVCESIPRFSDLKFSLFSLKCNACGAVWGDGNTSKKSRDSRNEAISHLSSTDRQDIVTANLKPTTADIRDSLS